MSTLTPKEFIKNVLIDEIGEIHQNHPYIAFALMAIGIEFLGKCLNTYEDWNESGHSKEDFEFAINNFTELCIWQSGQKMLDLFEIL